MKNNLEDRVYAYCDEEDGEISVERLQSLLEDYRLDVVLTQLSAIWDPKTFTKVSPEVFLKEHLTILRVDKQPMAIKMLDAFKLTAVLPHIREWVKAFPELKKEFTNRLFYNEL